MAVTRATLASLHALEALWDVQRAIARDRGHASAMARVRKLLPLAEARVKAYIPCHDERGRWTACPGGGSAGPARGARRRKRGKIRRGMRKRGPALNRTQSGRSLIVHHKGERKALAAKIRAERAAGQGDRESHRAAIDALQKRHRFGRTSQIGPRTPGTLLPGRPIAERLAAYRDGHERVAKLAALDDRVAPHREKVEQAQARLSEAQAAHKAAKGAEKKAAKKAMEDAAGELTAAHSRHIRAQDEARLAARDVLDTGKRFFLKAEHDPDFPLGDVQADSVGHAVRWYQSSVAPIAGKGGASPGDPHAVKMKAIPKAEEQRDYCDREGVKLSTLTTPAVVAHELGHHIDHQSSGALNSGRQFLEHRVGSEPLQQLREVLPRSGFGADETGRQDRFAEAFGERNAWYVGKDYGRHATEITSMGIEKMYADPVGFAKKDPEYAAFVLGIMHGHLR